MFQSLTLLFCAVFYLAVAAPSVRDLRVLSWNVNGVKKFVNYPSEQRFFAQHDLILLQETFSREENELFELRRFLGHHARAIPTDRRNRWGLSTLFRTTTFADGFLEQLPSPCDWLLLSRWRQPGCPGLIVMNIYAPLHSRCVSICHEFLD
jgi:exonuclease III